MNFFKLYPIQHCSLYSARIVENIAVPFNSTLQPHKLLKAVQILPPAVFP